MLFLVASLLIGSTLHAGGVNSFHNVLNKRRGNQCKQIQMQQYQIFEKMERIEKQLDVENIID
jgi:hypothetical protein